MSSEVKQLIIVVEGTAALAPSWHFVLSNYLNTIIGSFRGNASDEQRNPVTNVEMSLVIFYSRSSNSACLVQRSGWTNNFENFLGWLSSIQFSGDGFDGAALDEGLAEAYMMFSPPSGPTQPSNGFRRHCVIIAANNPHTLLAHQYRPLLQSRSHLLDAAVVASRFPKCSISLSVLSPPQLPNIRALYNAGKLNSQSADFSIYRGANPSFLLLVSENFLEARAAFGLLAVTPVGPVTGQPSAPGTLGSEPLSGPMQTELAYYVVIWEGDLYATIQGQPVAITRMECYRLRAPASASVAAYWPPDMHICGLISQDHMDMHFKANAAGDFLVLRAMTPHGFLQQQLVEKKFWAAIQLPSQTLFLGASDEPNFFTGMLYQEGSGGGGGQL